MSQNTIQFVNKVDICKKILLLELANEEVNQKLIKMTDIINKNELTKQEIITMYLERDTIMNLDPKTEINRQIKKLNNSNLEYFMNSTNLSSFYNACTLDELYVLGW